MDEDIKRIIDENPDGFTVDYNTHQPIRQGYVVAFTNWKAEDWDDSVVNGLMAKFGRQQYTVGGWKDGDTYYLDFGMIVYNLDEAKRIGRQYGQKAVFNLDTMETVYL